MLDILDLDVTTGRAHLRLLREEDLWSILAVSDHLTTCLPAARPAAKQGPMTASCDSNNVATA
eukprot:7703479-Karenia_brevis.AAC.1